MTSNELAGRIRSMTASYRAQEDWTDEDGDVIEHETIPAMLRLELVAHKNTLNADEHTAWSRYVVRALDLVTCPVCFGEHTTHGVECWCCDGFRYVTVDTAASYEGLESFIDRTALDFNLPAKQVWA